MPSIAVLAMGFAALGCGAVSDVRPVCPVQCDITVYALRGLQDIYSLGLDTITGRLNEAGVNATVLNGTGWQILGELIAERSSAGKNSGPLVIIGHSYGADNAISMARYLERFGVTIQELILLDATEPSYIPANVDRVLHVYQPTIFGDLAPQALAGNPVQAGPDNKHTQITNYVVSENLATWFGDLEYLNFFSHFFSDENVLIENLVIDEVLSHCPPAVCPSDQKTTTP